MLHIAIPRTARLQARAGEAVAKDTAQLLPGDLVTFGRGSRITHIGIYVGNGRFIHASTKAGRVIETALIRPPARGIKPWQGVRRIALADVDTFVDYRRTVALTPRQGSRTVASTTRRAPV